jgi:hypothetical protein
MELASFQCFIGPAIQYKMYKTASQWSCLHSSVSEPLEWRQLHCDAVLYILYGILVQWNTWMKTAPLWCCLIHFILDCFSNETLEWWQLHSDAVLYILYWIIVQWNTGMKHHNGAVFIPVFHWTRIPYKMYKTASQCSCLHSSVSLDKNPI